jgi:arginyl-tRNA synthetase
MWLLIKRISGNSSINKRRKTEEEAKTKHQSFWKHKKCLKWEAGDEEVISLWKKMNRFMMVLRLPIKI